MALYSRCESSRRCKGYSVASDDYWVLGKKYVCATFESCTATDSSSSYKSYNVMRVTTVRLMFTYSYASQLGKRILNWAIAAT